MYRRLRWRIPEKPEMFYWLVFTSANGISLFFDTLRARKTDLRVLAGRKIACIGSGTQSKLLEYGFVADLIPAEYSAGGLGEELCRQVKPGERILILRAEKGSVLLTQALDRKNCVYEDRKIYRTVPAAFPKAPDTEEPSGKDLSIDAAKKRHIVFGSTSGVEAWFASQNLMPGDVPVCIGKYTSQALPPDAAGRALIAKTYTAEGVADTISGSWQQDFRS